MKLNIYILLFFFPLFSSCQNKENEVVNIPNDTLKNSIKVEKDTLRNIISVEKDSLKNISYKEFDIIEFNDSIFSLYNFVKKSKVSVFIIGSKNCKPCIVLQNALKKKYLNEKNEKVQIFKVVVPTRDDKNYNSKGYIVFRDIDALAEIQPTTIIFAPTQNEYSRYKGIDNIDLLIADIDELRKFCK